MVPIRAEKGALRVNEARRVNAGHGVEFCKRNRNAIGVGLGFRKDQWLDAEVALIDGRAQG